MPYSMVIPRYVVWEAKETVSVINGLFTCEKFAALIASVNGWGTEVPTPDSTIRFDTRI
jgi:hypothetical protein